MTKFETIAQLLGVEMEEGFKVISENGILSSNTYKITDEGLIWGDKAIVYDMLAKLLYGEYKIKKLPWKPKEGDRYYYFDLVGVFSTPYRNSDIVDKFNMENGAVFKTHEGAEEMRLKVLEYIKKERGLI